MATDTVEGVASLRRPDHGVDLCAEVVPQRDREPEKNTRRGVAAESAAKSADLRIQTGDGRQSRLAFNRPEVRGQGDIAGSRVCYRQKGEDRSMGQQHLLRAHACLEMCGTCRANVRAESISLVGFR
jgi:hypothetical protein